jgi:uncharacterized membrane protein YgcG
VAEHKFILIYHIPSLTRRSSLLGYKLIVIFLLILSLHPLSVLAQGVEPPPPPTDGNVVLDTLDWLTPLQESQINSINRRLDEEGLAQIAVVTLDDCGDDPQRFRNELFRAWGIGHADDNDGLLILVCWYGGDASRRSLEQETGYGLEGTLPDILTSRVVDEIFIPAFQDDQPGTGLLAMVREYDRILRGGELEEPTSSPSFPSNNTNTPYAWLVTALLGSVPGFILATFYANIVRTERRPANFEIEMWDQMRYESTPRGFIFPRIRQIAVAEIISLIPILGLSFITAVLSFIPPDVRAYGPVVGENLFYWLIVLVFFTFQGGGMSGGGRGYGSGRFPTSRGGWSSSRGGFGGGRSGGGGSSKKF